MTRVLTDALLDVERDGNGAIVQYRMNRPLTDDVTGLCRYDVFAPDFEGSTFPKPVPFITLRGAGVREDILPDSGIRPLEITVRHPTYVDCDRSRAYVAVLQILPISTRVGSSLYGVGSEMYGYLGEPGFRLLSEFNADDADPDALWWPDAQPGRPDPASRLRPPREARFVIVHASPEK